MDASVLTVIFRRKRHQSSISLPQVVVLKLGNFSPKIGRVGRSIFFFFFSGAMELEKGLKWWVSEAKKWPEKGGLEGGTSPYYLPM